MKAIDIDQELVRRLVRSQFPQWSNLPIKPVIPGGWDNRTFQLGDSMLVRMPSGEEYAPKVDKEHYWLPRLAPQLPIAIPQPLAKGEPGEGYPWKWSIYHWLEGDTLDQVGVSNPSACANGLASFLTILQGLDTTDGPRPGPDTTSRGGPLTIYDEETRRAVEILSDQIDSRQAIKAWETALATTWEHPPVWVHGDISAGNLLIQEGRLSGVIDFGGLVVGDPACDLAIAWTYFRGESRRAFRETLGVDAGTWARGRAWALWKALIVASGLTQTNSIEAAHAAQTIYETMLDFRNSSIK